MNVFLTGATGYVGAVVARALQGRRHTVTALARSETAAAALLRTGLTVFRGALDDKKRLAEGAARADAVIHLAFSRDAAERADNAARLDLGAVTAMLGALSGTPRPFVYASCTEIVGDTGPAAMAETAPFRSAAAHAWRRDLERDVQSAGHGVVLRLPLVYGHGGGFMAAVVESARRQGCATFIADGKNVIPTAHVDDVADAFALALEHAPAGSVYNAVGFDTTLRSLVEAVGRVIGSPEKTRSLPLAQARGGLPRAEWLSMNQRFDASRIRTALSWAPRGLRIEEDTELSFRAAPGR